MAVRTWGEFRLALQRATSLPRGNKRDYVSYKTLVRWRFACALRGSARGFWFIDPLGLRPRGLCTVATRACHVNHAPPSYNYNMEVYVTNRQSLRSPLHYFGILQHQFEYSMLIVTYSNSNVPCKLALCIRPYYTQCSFTHADMKYRMCETCILVLCMGYAND